MNNRGFISTTVLYSFFLVILIVLLFIVSSLINNRILLNTLKEEIKEELSDDNLARYLVSQNESLGLVRHNSSLTGGSLDNSYRYVGSNPNNYICFGSDTDPCPSDNLYRIIGIFGGKIKIIKNTYATTMQYNLIETTDFSATRIYAYLNSDFLNTFSTSWQSAIANTTWYIGGIATTANTSAYNIYDYEVGDNRENVYVVSKIGLMYISDYAYATTTDNYTSSINSTSNWLYNGRNTWFITGVSGTTQNFYYLTTSGTLGSATISSEYEVRPVFYLNSNLKYVGGNGTYSSPYRVEV